MKFAENERQASRSVIAALRNQGWKVFRIEPGQGATPGLPDLLLLKDGVVFFAEIKFQNRQPMEGALPPLRATQRKAIAEWAGAGGYVVVIVLTAIEGQPPVWRIWRVVPVAGNFQMGCAASDADFAKAWNAAIKFA